MNAWVSYFNNDVYLRACRVLHKSLQASGTVYPLILLTHKKELVDRSTSTLIYHYVEDIGTELTENIAVPRYRFCKNKIHIWNLDDYDKLCWLDSDIIVLQNIDHLFDAEMMDCELRACRGCTCNVFDNPMLPCRPERCPFNSYENVYINSGLFLLRPNRQVFIDLAACDYDRPFSDQDVLSDFFKGRIILLDSTYNFLNHLPLIHPEEKYENPHVFHFGYGKPWENNTLDMFHRYYDMWKSLSDDGL